MVAQPKVAVFVLLVALLSYSCMASAGFQRDLQILGDFKTWLADASLASRESHGVFLNNRHPADQKVSLAHSGFTLATEHRPEFATSLREKLVERREALRRVMREDARAALAHAIDFHGFPPELAQLTERYVSGSGSFRKISQLAVADPHGTIQNFLPNLYSVSLEGTTYRAYTYGRLASLQSHDNALLHGFVLDNEMAVSESSIRLLHPDSPLVSGHATPSGHLFHGIEGTELRSFSSAAHILDTTPQIAATNTVGTLKGIFIRCMFSDDTSATQAAILSSYSDTYLQALGTQMVNFYQQNSYGASVWSWDIAPVGGVYQLPQTKATYVADSSLSSIFNDPKAAVSNINAYTTYVVVVQSVSGWGFGGVGYVGYWGAVLNGDITLRTCSHEVGHNLGLEHANQWTAAVATNPIGAGSGVQYGDAFDAMGLGDSTGNRHYNIREKLTLTWIDSSHIKVLALGAASTGNYRIYAHDMGTLPTSPNVVGLFVQVSSPTQTMSNLYYSVEVRNKFWTHTNGVGVQLRYVKFQSGVPSVFNMELCSNANQMVDASGSCSSYGGSSFCIDMQPYNDGSPYDDSVAMGLTQAMYFADTNSQIYMQIVDVHASTSSTDLTYVDLAIVAGTNNCNGHGTLNNATCACNTGWTGLDCATSSSATKNLTAGTSPAVGSSYALGSPVTFTWTTTGTITSVVVSYLSASSTQIPIATVSNIGTFTWTIWTNITLTSTRLRVTDTASSTYADSAVFSLTPAVLPVAVTFSTPTAASTWLQGSGNSISWTVANCASATSTSVSVQNVVTQTSTVLTTVAAGVTSYTWTIPAAFATGTYSVVLTTCGTTATSPQFLIEASVAAAVITVTGPTGTALQGSVQDVTWTSSNCLGTSPTQVLIINTARNQSTGNISCSNTGSKSFMTPTTYTGTFHSEVYACGTVGIGPNFQIIAAPTSVTFTAPLPNATVQLRSPMIVTWSTVSCSTPDTNTIYLVQQPTSLNPGVTTTIGTNVPGGSLTYTLPVATTNLGLYTLSINVCGITQSSGIFSIIDSTVAVVVIAPNSNSSWQEGSIQTVVWNTTSCSSNKTVVITLIGVSEFSPLPQVTIYSGSNTGSYQWAIPASQPYGPYQLAVTACGVRTQTPTFHVTSDAQLTFTSPNPSSPPSWAAGSYQTVTWNSVVCPDNQMVTLSISSATMSSTQLAVIPNFGQFVFHIPLNYAVGAYTLTLSGCGVTSSANLNVVDLAADIVRPLPGDRVFPGFRYLLLWLGAASATQTLSYAPNTTNGTYQQIFSGSLWPDPVTSLFSYVWMVPSSLTAGNYLLKLVSGSTTTSSWFKVNNTGCTFTSGDSSDPNQWSGNRTLKTYSRTDSGVLNYVGASNLISMQVPSPSSLNLLGAGPLNPSGVSDRSLTLPLVPRDDSNSTNYTTTGSVTCTVSGGDINVFIGLDNVPDRLNYDLMLSVGVSSTSTTLSFNLNSGQYIYTYVEAVTAPATYSCTSSVQTKASVAATTNNGSSPSNNNTVIIVVAVVCSVVVVGAALGITWWWWRRRRAQQQLERSCTTPHAIALPESSGIAPPIKWSEPVAPGSKFRINPIGTPINDTAMRPPTTTTDVVVSVPPKLSDDSQPRNDRINPFAY